jgi:hypothetical protein
LFDFIQIYISVTPDAFFKSGVATSENVIASYMELIIYFISCIFSDLKQFLFVLPRKGMRSS